MIDPHFLDAGTACETRKTGSQDWHPMRTRAKVTMIGLPMRDATSPDHWVFRLWTIEVRVEKRFVRNWHREKPEKPKRVRVNPHQFFPLSKGKGASRRRSYHTVRAWKGRKSKG
jgi:hypothetical protein